jgi:hypothetical protein
VLGHSTGACSKSKDEARTVEKAGSASVATINNVKGSVFTRLRPPIDAPSANAPSVAPSPIDPVDAPPAATPKFDDPTVPTVHNVTQDDQQGNQSTEAGSEGWETVRKSRTSNKQRLPPAKILSASAKGKEVAGPADVNGNRRHYKVAEGMLTRSSVQRKTNMSSGSGGEPPTIPSS